MCTKEGVHWAFDVYICGGGEGKGEGGKRKGERGGGAYIYLLMCTLLIKVHFPKVKNAYITHKMRTSGTVACTQSFVIMHSLLLA